VSAAFADLLATPGVDEQLVLRGELGVMAYHGGSLEETTDVVAAAVAERTGSSYYAVLQPPDLNWHIPSHHVRGEHSRALQQFFDHVHTVVTIHGFGRRGYFASLLLGGRNRALAEHLGSHLRAALPAYDVITDLEQIPRELRGQHEHNPVNVPTNAGVQIELPPRVRGSSPLWADWEGERPVPHTRALIDGLVAGLQAWPGSGSR
jgi:phage replication-related protein YjqB (UPF0714/DUF867 family)